MLSTLEPHSIHIVHIVHIIHIIHNIQIAKNYLMWIDDTCNKLEQCFLKLVGRLGGKCGSSHRVIR